MAQDVTHLAGRPAVATAGRRGMGVNAKTSDCGAGELPVAPT
ncbi:hypothetical protein [Micromonospora mirobrigensis]|nr:hypothetical protein [Micromonospora mirobrigensis]